MNFYGDFLFSELKMKLFELNFGSYSRSYILPDIFCEQRIFVTSKLNFSELHDQFAKQKDGRAIIFIPTRDFAGQLSEELNKDENLQMLDVKSDFITGIIRNSKIRQKMEHRVFL